MTREEWRYGMNENVLEKAWRYTSGVAVLFFAIPYFGIGAIVESIINKIKK